MGSFRPGAGNQHLHWYFNFTGCIVETALKSLRLSCGSELTRQGISLAISVASVAFMCPLMSLAATILFKNAGSQFVAVWLQTTAMNFPMAFFWQLIYAGPIVRFIFRHIFRENEAVQAVSASAE